MKLMDEHHKTCELFPVECPSYAFTIFRLNLIFTGAVFVVYVPNSMTTMSRALKKVCIEGLYLTNLVLPCPFEPVGCLVKMKRKEIAVHTKESMEAHLTLTCLKLTDTMGMHLFGGNFYTDKPRLYSH